MILFELAIALPILLLIFFGIIQLALVYNARMVTAYATYVGTREAAIGGDYRDSRLLTEVIMSSLDLKVLLPGVSSLVLDADFVNQGSRVHGRVAYMMPIRMPMVQKAFNFFGSLLGFSFKEVGCSYELQRE